MLLLFLSNNGTGSRRGSRKPKVSGTAQVTHVVKQNVAQFKSLSAVLCHRY